MRYNNSDGSTDNDSSNVHEGKNDDDTWGVGFWV